MKITKFAAVFVTTPGKDKFLFIYISLKSCRDMTLLEHTLKRSWTKTKYISRFKIISLKTMLRWLNFRQYRNVRQGIILSISLCSIHNWLLVYLWSLYRFLLEIQKLLLHFFMNTLLYKYNVWKLTKICTLSVFQ